MTSSCVVCGIMLVSDCDRRDWLSQRDADWRWGGGVRGCLTENEGETLHFRCSIVSSVNAA